MEGAVKGALTFVGNASLQCTSLCQTRILEEYNKDLVSFRQESAELFASAANILFGPSFPEKAAKHIKQLQTLHKLRAVVVSLTRFSPRPPHGYTQQGGQVQPAKVSSRPTILQRRSKRPGSPVKSADQVQ